MGGKRGKKKGPNATLGAQPRVSMTLREESSGKKQGNVNAKTMCKLDHLKNLAVWAAAEASIPSLGAFFGERFAATNEAVGLRADPSLFVCERCESILQPGHNCTVRIEKNKSKVRHRRKKHNLTSQNSVIYRCHLCSHRNMMRGTPKGYLKEICPVKPKPALKSKIARPAVETSSPATPLPTTGLSLLDSKRRKRNRSGAKKVAEPETAAEAEKSMHASSKRRKKSWTSLKEIAEQNIGNKFTNLTIPFFI